ncbi:hypothetical protein [Anderseniella sp. Alg231-50]|uniref:hypothetical protein n=1 Tax=Anderseniella sp. Alg231-50 TaxID=1922226 RepID=UPI00307C8D33
MSTIRNFKGAGPIWLMAGASLVLVAMLPGDLQAATRCIFNWAQPGTYKMSGNFRGTTEAATARLTHDCRVYFQVPGVFSGGPVRRSGRCLKFRFKVDGEARIFSARWCNTYGVVPWQGRDVRASVTRIKIAVPPTPQRRNFNVK